MYQGCLSSQETGPKRHAGSRGRAGEPDDYFFNQKYNIKTNAVLYL
jgi:hypothetical protein